MGSPSKGLKTTKRGQRGIASRVSPAPLNREHWAWPEYHIDRAFCPLTLRDIRWHRYRQGDSLAVTKFNSGFLPGRALPAGLSTLHRNSAGMLFNHLHINRARLIGDHPGTGKYSQQREQV